MCYKEEKQKFLSKALEIKFQNVPNFIIDFFEGYKSVTTRNCTWGYVRDLLQWLLDKKYINKKNIIEISKEDINNITSNMIIKYLNELKSGNGGVKNTLSSINTKKNVFSSFWNYMVLNKIVDENIIQHISNKLFKSETSQKEIKIPSKIQLEMFLSNLSSGNGNEFDIVRNMAIVQLFLGSGIRSEELINLDLKDLFILEEKPYIRVLGKGNIEEYDTVYISAKAVDYLYDYLKYRTSFVKENGIEHENALFLSNRKKRIGKTAITNLFNRYSDGTIYPHMLRHLVGTILYKRTKDIALVQRQLRHKNIATAIKYYVHLDDNDIVEAVAGLNWL